MNARKLLRPAVTGLAVASIAVACQKVPYTGRSQYNIVPESTMHELGRETYVAMLQGKQVERGTRDAQILEKVGRNIAGAANQPDYAWEFSLIRDDDMNAWALPGGYIGFHTGILPVLRNEAGMAFVMGHEVGHATAEHGAERMSQQLTVVGGLTALDAFLSGGAMSAGSRNVIIAALGLGAEVGVLLPFSRTHEAEADVIGMMYMADAGYPPDESLDVWDRMARAQTGSRPPEFLSTHPDFERRQQNQLEWLPRAQKRYQRNALPYDTTETLWSGDRRGVSRRDR